MAINEPTPPETSIKGAFEAAGIGKEKTEERGHARRTAPTDRSDLTAAGIDSYFGHAFRNAPSNQSTKEFEKAFNKILEDNLKGRPDDPVRFSISSIDSSDSQDVSIAAILFIGHFTSGGKARAAVFILLLDGSMDAYPTAIITDAPSVNGRPQEIQLTAGDYAEAPLWNAIVQKLQNTQGANVDYVSVGNATLPRYISAEKEEHRNRLYTALYTGISAIYLHMHSAFGIGPGALTIETITKRANTVILMDLNDQPTFTATGMPVRSDITMTLRSIVRSAVPGVQDKAVDIVKLAGYVDLLWTMPPAPTTLNQRQDTRRYTPYFVISDLTSLRSVLTPETQLAALAMAPLLDHNDQYLAAFTASATANRPYRNFGALGLEVNLSSQEGLMTGSGIEDPKKMSTAEFYQMAQLCLFPELHVALAIDKAGALTWLNSMFLEAALEPNGDAHKAVLAAADNLTGKVFTEIWQGGEIAYPMNTRYHVGYYFDDNNDMRDLQDIDYLWMLNRCGPKHIEAAWAFSDTFLGDGSPDAALVARWEIIQKFVRNATLIGYGQRVEINPQFLIDLIQACKRAGLPLRSNTSLIDFQGVRGRASYQGTRGLNKSAINATLNAGGERRGPSTLGGLGLNTFRHRGM